MSAQIDTIRTKYRQLENNRETNAQWLEEMKQSVPYLNGMKTS